MQQTALLAVAQAPNGRPQAAHIGPLPYTPSHRRPRLRCNCVGTQAVTAVSPQQRACAAPCSLLATSTRLALNSHRGARDAGHGHAVAGAAGTVGSALAGEQGYAAAAGQRHGRALGPCRASDVDALAGHMLAAAAVKDTHGWHVLLGL